MHPTTPSCSRHTTRIITTSTTRALLLQFAVFNPHASFQTVVEGQCQHLLSTQPDWRKWTPADETSPTWYTPETLRDLIAAFIRAERESGGPAVTVRQFVERFAGLRGTAAQQAVTTAAGLHDALLRDLIGGDDLARDDIPRLLHAMQARACPVPPRALGIIGERHILDALARHYSAAPSSLRYALKIGVADTLPFVLEAAFGVFDPRHDWAARQLVIGLNWSPALRVPFDALDALLDTYRIDFTDPVVLCIHLACPRLVYTDAGKGTLALPGPIVQALEQLLGQVTRDWVKAKRRAGRSGRVRAGDLARLQDAPKPTTRSIKDAAFAVMTQAYLKASDDNRLPTNARQIMYCARPLVLALTGGRCWQDSDYFTQTLLPDYLEQHPDQTADWDVVFDARGRLMEPHTGRATELGSRGVRAYIQGWSAGAPPALAWAPNYRYRTSGPMYRYRYVLFVEKEGFYQLLEAANIAAQYDLAIMSTKGMSVVAARRLVDELSGQGVTILVVRDFDKTGFSIVHTLRSDSRRYRFRHQPRVIDLGLRLADAERLGLQREPVVYQTKVDPRENLRARGATEAECAVLVQQQAGNNRWEGERVELNAMDSSQFVGWLQERLAAAEVRKVVPERAVLAATYGQAWRLARLQQLVGEVTAQARDADIAIPTDLEQIIRRHLAKRPVQAWDDVVWELAQTAHGAPDLQQLNVAISDAGASDGTLVPDAGMMDDGAGPDSATAASASDHPLQPGALQNQEADATDMPSRVTGPQSRLLAIDAVRAAYAAARAAGKTPDEALIALVEEFDSLPSTLCAFLYFDFAPRPIRWPEEAEVRAAYEQVRTTGKPSRELVARLAVQLNTDPEFIRITLRGLI